MGIEQAAVMRQSRVVNGPWAQPRTDQRTAEVCSAKFRAGLFNGSVIAIGLWAGLFYAVHG